ncbi:RagB/SusD family nutrient uptake outer membrane protein [Pedobacter sp. FW305-3-2-15-E-R2A2]|uniref:RagB/SusD family nutrient uptake outer membrane protein n=1 Tax=Pedobacter sp. FW305-3-2-15-E-R2A2 TaxID=3140251 RepID=UPI0031403BB1
MKKLTYKICLGLFLVAISSSCRKYVEVDRYGERTLKYTEDFQYLVNNRGNFEKSYILPLVTNDDMASTDLNHQNSMAAEIKAAYVWGSAFYGDTQSDIGWNNLYKSIYTCNEIIFSVMSSQKGTDAQKKEIYAEALVQRAFAYLMLANQYGEVYDPAKAQSQVGIPLLTTPDLFQKLERSSLKKIYEQIISDVEQAIPSLPDRGTNNGHAAKVSAYALLSRTHLYMRNFNLAGEYADKALAINSSLNTLETYIGNTASFPRRHEDPEVLLSRLSAGSFFSQLNPELINLFTPGDVRRELFTGTTFGVPGTAYIRPQFNEFASHTGLSVPEMMLNRAEVYARAGDVSKTLELLNKLRKTRIKVADYQELSVSGPADLLPAVINERRRELMGTGLRWFDQRRLNLDPEFAKPYVRTFLGQQYTLSPGSNRYIYPIAPAVLDLNPEIQQSPR